MKTKWTLVVFLIAGLLGAAERFHRAPEEEFRIAIRLDGFTSFQLPMR